MHAADPCEQGTDDDVIEKIQRAALRQLEKMGFSENVKNAQLLQQFNYDVQQVVDCYIDHMTRDLGNTRDTSVSMDAETESMGQDEDYGQELGTKERENMVTRLISQHCLST